MNECVPVCKDGCVNGRCSASNDCECQPGYVKVSSSMCLPDCPNGCKNGFCSAPGKYSCNEGYFPV
ncbi:uncharacterized protein Dmoj_GI26262 [Drosophila mojavensis]|uniref:EGF-like domain-containing protein n=1 Tax=Drosophila mojavensis TaxID=7230 RepID=A0A0Q9X5B2_DROMO|nr:uncharacterized protein Dmoj_GI26262 [Drosophila mojavensis]